MIKRPAHNFFHFTRKEKTGTLVLLGLIVLLMLTPFFYGLIFPEKVADAVKFEPQLSALEIKTDSNRTENKYRSSYDNSNARQQYPEKILPQPEKISLFRFDPNTLNGEGWRKLGLADRTISTIKNYLSKGGKFREAEDLKKIWGIHEDQVMRMLPFVDIKAAEIPPPASYEKKEYPKKNLNIPDINEADSIAYVSLPGIGPGFAKRIIKFRERLGGFYSIAQVGETFGLPDSTFQQIKQYLQVDAGKIRKINLNTATADELKNHPYLRYQLTNAIVQYRAEHGNFIAVDDLKKIMLITDDVFIKVAPYLTVN